MTTPPVPSHGAPHGSSPPHGTGAPMLFTKPGTITAAQVMLWLQFSTMICFGIGSTLFSLIGAAVLHQARTELRDFPGVPRTEAFTVVMTGLTVVSILLTILIGILAAKIGAGRRWAQVATLILMLAFLLPGCVGAYRFTASGYADAAVSAPAGLLALLWLAMPVVTILCLVTGSANQWFRQGGWAPVRAQWHHQPPYHG